MSDDVLCESCGADADVRLADDSAWCLACHASALRQGYDNDFGTALYPRLELLTP